MLDPLQQLRADFVAQPVGDNDGDFLVFLQEGAHVPLKKFLLRGEGRGGPDGGGINHLLPVVVEFEQEVVAVEIFHPLGQRFQQRGLAGGPAVVNKLAVVLIQPVPTGGIFAQAIAQGVNAEVGLLQGGHELGGLVDGFIQVVEVVEPVAGAATADERGAVGGGNGALGHLLHQVRQDFLVDEAEIVQAGESAGRAAVQVVFDVEDGGTFFREFFKGSVVAATIFPAVEKNNGLRVEPGRLFQPQGVAGFEQLDGEIAQARTFGDVTKVAFQPLPQKGVQPGPPDQAQAVILPGGQFSQQRFQNGVQARFGAPVEADSGHFQADGAGGVVPGQPRFERGPAAGGSVELGVILHHVPKFRRQADLAQPQRDLVGPEVAVGQQHIQQPVVQVGRPGAFMVEQKLLARFFAQDTILDPVLIVFELDLLHVRQGQGLVFGPQFLFFVVPEDEAVGLKQSL